MSAEHESEYARFDSVLFYLPCRRKREETRAVVSTHMHYTANSNLGVMDQAET